ncbi:MAG: 2-hydroxyacid dehydrogenase [Candidatus Sericytochromatia bacterium]|nr:2-hydroxyacid dehydrogenase [Candidatus Sericytochromatia bacterium]
MKLAFFSTKPYEKHFFEKINVKYNHQITFFDAHLNMETISLVKGFQAVCVFVNDTLDEQILEKMAENNVKLIVLRSAGFNNVDIKAAHKLGLSVVRVPAYSPYAVAEHSLALIMTLNRKIHKAYNRIRDDNFSLDGLMGFDIHTKTVGIFGTGKIGQTFAKIMSGFGCRLIAFDLFEDKECLDLGVEYVSCNELFATSDIISLHCPLNHETHHLINKKTLSMMKKGVMLINTSRGGLIDTPEIINSLKDGKIGYLGLDVYEEEADIFFEDLSGKVLQDDVLARLLTFQNVIVTSHQAFFTDNAMNKIAETSLDNISKFEQNIPVNLVLPEKD